MHESTRRHFLASAGQSLLAAGLMTTAASAQPIQLPPTEASTERQPGPQDLPLPPDQRVGFAVVGLGNLTVNQILPAFAKCKRARLVALVSGDPAKAKELALQHGLTDQACLSYENFDKVREMADVQVIYIVLPNSMHAEYTLRGAAAGKHILCEKPMATSVEEAEQMVQACAAANRKLMIAYRIQYEPHNRYMRELADSKTFGRVKVIESVNTQNQGDPSQWRLKKKLSGGGSLPDIGLYCLNTTRYLTGEEPDEIVASTFSTPGDPRFTEVEETVTWQMRFPSGICSNNVCCYGAHESRRYRILAETGWFGLDPAFSYTAIKAERSHAEGTKELHDNPEIEAADQFALEMDHMAECVAENKRPNTPGEEGLQDQRLMAAIYESARTGRPVQLPTVTTRDTYRGTSLRPRA